MRRQGGWSTPGCLIALAIAGAVFLAGGYGIYRYGMNIIEEEVKADLQANPVVRQHLGELQELELDLMGTGELPDEYDFAFRVVGTKGSGTARVAVTTGTDDVEHVIRGTLTLESGEEHDLFPPSPDAGEER